MVSSPFGSGLKVYHTSRQATAQLSIHEVATVALRAKDYGYQYMRLSIILEKRLLVGTRSNWIF
jgi:hypothetical protein